jgi:hypothetical protein
MIGPSPFGMDTAARGRPQPGGPAAHRRTRDDLPGADRQDGGGTARGGCRVPPAHGGSSPPLTALALTDAELLARLSACGITLDRPLLQQLSAEALSAEEIARTLEDRMSLRGARRGWESDWIWICVEALWRRWFPETPSFKRLDDEMARWGVECRSASKAHGDLRWNSGWSRPGSDTWRKRPTSTRRIAPTAGDHRQARTHAGDRT